MSKFKSHQEIIVELKHFSDKLAKGTLSLKELEAYQYLIRTLYERVIVLQYKAQEKFTKEKLDNLSSSNLAIADNKQDFALTPETDDSNDSTIQFDFTSISKTEEESNASELEEIPIPTKEESKQDVENDNDTEVFSAATAATIEEVSNENNSNEVVNSFFDQFLIYQDDSLLGKLGTSKIDSLKGAFGLNDRLQIIHELFNGDTEEFQESIDKLDMMTSFEQAKVKLNEIAAQHQWEPDHLIVGDFVKMIQRRYV